MGECNGKSDDIPFESKKMKEPSLVPTKNVKYLKSLVGKKIYQMYSFDPEGVEGYIAYHDDVSPGEEFDISDAFSLCATILIIALGDGTCISLSSNNEIGSVEVETGCYDELVSAEDKIFEIPADDPIYSTREWAGILGKKIEGFSVIYRKDQYPGYPAKPFECGVIIHLADGTEFLYGDDVREACSNPSVFFKADMVAPQELIIKRLV